MNGSCRPWVAASTRSRTRRKNSPSSRPGVCNSSIRAVGVGAVGVGAVLGHGVGARRHGDQRVARRVVDPGETGPDLGGPRGPHAFDQPVDERVVAAGVQDHEAELLRTGELAQEQGQRHRLVEQVAHPLELGVGGYEIVGAVHLHAVAGIIDHRHVRLGGADAEVAQGVGDLAAAKIELQVDLEVECFQLLGDGLRIPDRGHQLRGVHVIGDADHQGEPRLGLGGRGGGGDPKQDTQPDRPSYLSVEVPARSRSRTSHGRIVSPGP